MRSSRPISDATRGLLNLARLAATASLLVAAAAARPASAGDLVQLEYVIEPALATGGTEVLSAPLSAPAADPCYAGVAACSGQPPASYTVQEATVEVDPGELGLLDGLQRLVFWFTAEDAAGGERQVTARRTVWFSVRRDPPSFEELQVEFALDGGGWTEPQDLATGPPGCAEAPLLTWLAGAPPGTHDLRVRLVESGSGRTAAERWTLFAVRGGAAPPAPLLAPEVPGETCGNGEDDDGDGLADDLDPECGAEPGGPTQAFAPLGACEDGEHLFALEEVDPAEYHPQPAPLVSGTSFAIAPGVTVTEPGRERDAARVPLLTAPPLWPCGGCAAGGEGPAACVFDPCGRRLSLSWPESAFRWIDVHVERRSADACRRLAPGEPPAPGARLPRGSAEHALDLGGAGGFDVWLVGRTSELVGFASCPAPLDVGPPCALDLDAWVQEPRPGGPAVCLAWQASTGCELGAAVVLRDGTERATLPPGTEEYCDEDVEEGATYTYEVRVGVSRPDWGLPGCQLAATRVVTVPARGPRFVRADVDQDGKVDLSDGIKILIYLFRTQAPLPCLDAADADDSGGLNLTDAVTVFVFLFRGGSIPPPSPETTGETTAADPGDCGPDPTGDGVDCQTPPPYCG